VSHLSSCPLVLAALTLAVLPCDGAEASGKATEPPLVPWPRSATVKDGTLELAAASRIVASERTLRPLATILAEEIALATGLRLTAATDAPHDGDLVLELANDLKGENYTLTVGARAIVRGSGYNAVALGTVTLLQALRVADGTVRLPHLVVEDGPHFPYCGAMLDVARKPYSLDTLRQCVQVCRFYKIRYLHLHLTDENAWTFPSTAFPTLGKHNFAWAGGSKPTVYRIDDLKALVAYADARGVTLVPEIEMPGHSGQMRAALPETFGYTDEKGKRVSLGVINMVSEEAFRALDTIVGEVCAVFRSSPYFVMGGDESSLGGTERMPEVKAFLAKHKLADTHAVFNAFVNRMYGIVKKHGKRPIVWEGAPLRPVAPPKDLIVLPWVGGGGTAAALVRDGYTVINPPWGVKTPYMDPYHVNGAQLKKGEPLLRGATSILWESPQEAAVPYLRQTGALRNEPTWNPNTGRDHADFLRRLRVTDARLDRLLYGFTFETEDVLDPTVAMRLEPLFVKEMKATRVPSTVRVRYTLDGKEPTADSPVCDKALTLRKTTTLKARWFAAEGKPLRPTFTREYRKLPSVLHDAIGAKATLLPAQPGYYGPGPRGLTDGLLADGDQSGSSGWVGWTRDGKPIEIRLDLGKPIRLTQLAAHFLRSAGGVSLPRQVEYAVSEDGKAFRTLATIDEKAGGAARGWYVANVAATTARYLRLRVTAAGDWTFTDEVAVNPTLPGPTLRHAALDKPVTLKYPPAQGYNLSGVKGLTDGHVARSPDFLNPQWLGVEGKNIESVIDLGRPTAIRRVGGHFLQHVGAGIRIPGRVDILVSDDGEKFRSVAVIEHKQSEQAAYLKTLQADIKDVQARYVKLVAHTNGLWLFADEVFVNPADGDAE
jgi:hexosaminidase